MDTSGTIAKATSDDDAVDLFTLTGVPDVGVVIINEGSNPGFFSLDGGVSWGRLPNNTAIGPLPVKFANNVIQIKRSAGGANLADVYGWAV